MADQQYCLRWNNHQSTLISVFDSLQERGCMVDCTLAAEGQSLQAHKVVLSACSPYLEDLLSKHYDKHPILLLKDVKFEELKAMMDYMYRGEVNVAQDKLNTFLRAAESLQIKGLSDGGTDPPDSGGTTSTKRTAKGTPVSVRSNQLTVRKTNLDDSSSRDGSTSPSQRKRRRRRGSETSDIETSNVSDGKQSTAAAAPVSGPSETSPIVPASAPSDDNILSSITESAETENATDSGFSSAVPQEINNVIRDRDNALLEPKTEYLEEDGQDLNLEDEDGLFRAGPSHARGTYEGDGDDDVYMTNQDSGANAQGYFVYYTKPSLRQNYVDENAEDPLQSAIHDGQVQDDDDDDYDDYEDGGVWSHVPSPSAPLPTAVDPLLTSVEVLLGTKPRRSPRKGSPRSVQVKREPQVPAPRPGPRPRPAAIMRSKKVRRGKLSRTEGPPPARTPATGTSKHWSNNQPEPLLLQESNTTRRFRCRCRTVIHGGDRALLEHWREVHVEMRGESQNVRAHELDDELAQKLLALSCKELKPYSASVAGYFNCPLCSKMLTHQRLKTHLFCHMEHPPMNYVCQVCGRGFSEYSGIWKHYATMHKDFKPYKCTYCDKSFRTPLERKRHTRNHHEIEISKKKK